MLILVPTPIGNLDDISSRSLKALLEAQLIFCEDTRVTKRLLHLLEEKNNLKFSCCEFKSFHSHNEKDVLSKLSFDDFDKNVVYVCDAGMPCVSDPGSSLIQFAIENDIPYDVIPGANAALTAFAMSGFNNTQFTFFGFLDHKGKSRISQLNTVMQSFTLTIFYESPHRLLKTLEEISNIDPNRIIFLVKEISKKFQKTYKDKAVNVFNTLKNENIRGEWVIIVQSYETLGFPISIDDVNSLDIAPKIKAKLLAKMQGLKTKDVYQDILDKLKL